VIFPGGTTRGTSALNSRAGTPRGPTWETPLGPPTGDTHWRSPRRSQPLGTPLMTPLSYPHRGTSLGTTPCVTARGHHIRNPSGGPALGDLLSGPALADPPCGNHLVDQPWGVHAGEAAMRDPPLKDPTWGSTLWYPPRGPPGGPAWNRTPGGPVWVHTPVPSLVYSPWVTHLVYRPWGTHLGNPSWGTPQGRPPLWDSPREPPLVDPRWWSTPGVRPVKDLAWEPSWKTTNLGAPGGPPCGIPYGGLHLGIPLASPLLVDPLWALLGVLPLGPHLVWYPLWVPAFGPPFVDPLRCPLCLYSVCPDVLA
jgi:hypothetical protein